LHVLSSVRITVIDMSFEMTHRKKCGGDRSGDLAGQNPLKSTRASHGCDTLADEASVQPDVHYLKTCSSAGTVIAMI
jgi:hypothetical protein